MLDDICPLCGSEIGFSTVETAHNETKVVYFCRSPKCDWAEEYYEEEDSGK